MPGKKYLLPLLLLFSFAACMLITFGLEATFIVWMLPVAFFCMMIVIVICGSAKMTARIRKKKAPLWYKFFTFAKPVLAAAACWFVQVFYPNTDEYAYAAAIFAIVMIILTAFDIVRAQNRFTMRDLPVFNEKRGGDE